MVGIQSQPMAAWKGLGLSAPSAPPFLSGALTKFFSFSAAGSGVLQYADGDPALGG